MIVLRISSAEIRYAAVQPPSSGSSPAGWPRGLEGEHDRGQQRARGAGEHRRHADQRGDARIDAEPRRQRSAMPMPSSAPSAPPMVNSGASVPPEVPLPSAIAQERNFSTHSERPARARVSWPATIVLDVVVAHAQRARREIADHADRDAADRRPPHPVDRQLLEHVLDAVDEPRHAHADQAEQGADARCSRPAPQPPAFGQIAGIANTGAGAAASRSARRSR